MDITVATKHKEECEYEYCDRCAPRMLKAAAQSEQRISELEKTIEALLRENGILEDALTKVEERERGKRRKEREKVVNTR